MVVGEQGKYSHRVAARTHRGAAGEQLLQVDDEDGMGQRCGCLLTRQIRLNHLTGGDFMGGGWKRD